MGDPLNFPTDCGRYSRPPPPFKVPVIDQQLDMDENPLSLTHVDTRAA